MEVLKVVLGSDVESSRRFRMAKAESDGGATLDAHHLLLGAGVEAGPTVVCTVGEGLYSQHHFSRKLWVLSEGFWF